MKVGAVQPKISRNQPMNFNSDKENMCNCEKKRMTFSIKSHKCTPSRTQKPFLEISSRDSNKLLTTSKKAQTANTEHSPQPQAAFFKLQDLVSKTATFSSPMTKIERAKILQQPLTSCHKQATPPPIGTASVFTTAYGTPKPPASGNYASNPTPLKRPSSRQKREMTSNNQPTPTNRHHNCSNSTGRRETEVSPNGVPAFTGSTKTLRKSDIQYAISDRYAQKIDTLF